MSYQHILSQVMAEPHAKIKNAEPWTQLESDVIAHCIQCVGQISNSKWRRSDCSYTTQGNKIVGESRFPDPEQTFFAAIYLRQLIGGDRLFQKSCEIYCKYVCEVVRASLVIMIQESLNQMLASFHSRIAISDITNQQFFDAILYGALVFHGPASPDSPHFNRNNQNRETFNRIVREVRTEDLLFDINRFITDAYCYTNHAAVLFNRDFAAWSNQGLVPRTNVNWHNSIFVAPSQNQRE